MSKYTLYTDGGCAGAPGPGGWAAVIVEEGKEPIKLSGSEMTTTNNRMELTALLMGIDYLLSIGVTEGVTIISDSQYIIGVYTDWMHKWYKDDWTKKGGEIKNLDIVKELYSRYTRLKLDEYKWVKGHSGDPYNELCDYLATQAISNLIAEAKGQEQSRYESDPTYAVLNQMTKEQLIRLFIDKGFKL